MPTRACTANPACQWEQSCFSYGGFWRGTPAASLLSFWWGECVQPPLAGGGGRVLVTLIGATPCKCSPVSHKSAPLIRKCTPLGPYRRHMSRVLGGWAFSDRRGTPVALERSFTCVDCRECLPHGALIDVCATYSTHQTTGVPRPQKNAFP